MKIRNIPFGYRLENGSIRISPSEAETVRTVFRLYGEGLSFLSISRELQAHGAAYIGGEARWNKNNVSRILRNRLYLGENGYPAILPREQFEAIQCLLSERKNKWATPRKKPEQQEQGTASEKRPCETVFTAYEPSPEQIRLTNEIGRLLEKPEDPAKARQLIYAALGKRYQQIRNLQFTR